MMNNTQINFIKNHYPNYNLTQLQKDINAIDIDYQAEVLKWVIGGHKIKLLVLGEAPQAPNKYFYNKKNPGGFLSLLKAQHYGNYSNANGIWLDFLRSKGIFVLDMFEPVLPSGIYRAKGSFTALFDNVYIQNKIQALQGLFHPEISVVFRYKTHITAQLFNQPALKNLNYIKDKVGNHCPLGIKANAGILNLCVIPNLP